MLAQMSPQEFNERYAHSLVEPWGKDWERTGELAKAVHDAMDHYIAFKTGRKQARPANRWWFIDVPEWLFKIRTKKRGMTDEESLRNMS